MFFGAFGPTGFMNFVKTCELIGGILVAIPVTLNFGLLLLGPVIVNITGGAGLLDPPTHSHQPALGLSTLDRAQCVLWPTGHAQDRVMPGRKIRPAGRFNLDFSKIRRFMKHKEGG